MKQLVDDVQKVAPDQPVNQSVIAGYLSADLFLAAAQKAGKDLTIGKLISAANKNFTYAARRVSPGPRSSRARTPSPRRAARSCAATASPSRSSTAYSCGKVVKVSG